MPTILIGVGAVLLVFTFLLAFTILGEISALLGVACIVIGALLLGRHVHGPDTD
jgi:hypothetical protein